MKLDYCQTHRGAPVEDAALPCLAIRHDDGRRATQRELWAEIERLRAENAALKRDLQYARDGLTKGRTRMREDNERLAREAHTWSKAAETYAAELERYKPLVRAVRNVLEDGQVYAEDLALLRQALEQVERALGPNAELTGGRRPSA